ncbi:2',3'-cyclic nucleotide 3'-phosphodiesterase [Xylographa carneopallida]|nr:2',3'-cyclic nucleotide 3'-phosphodiesterase [Xylographa carneopallida]
MAFSLWLTPPPGSPMYAHLSQFMCELPKADPSLSASPAFLPHITVVSGLPQPSTSSLSRLKLPAGLTISFNSLSFGSAYFKKIHFSIERSHTSIELAKEARVNLQSMWKGEAERAVELEYDPHASLIYSDVGLNDPIKEVARQTVKLELEKSGHTTSEGLGWRGGQLLLVKTEGPVDQWKVLKTIDTTG